ncbi:MAG: aminotransferase class I/II-fold pyridoxal phosphate-dependent enzyme [Proteobacteria bacterium]|nr:aminotransferase class I/II-fold pyridoxal phosphate-dependent enzyme [Pseudomonadota bacterium]
MSLRFASTFAALPAVTPFVGTEKTEQELGFRFSARLGANENQYGPSTNVVRAITNAAAEVWKYPDPDLHLLRGKLFERLGIPMSMIAIGEGIDGLLGITVRMFVEHGTPVVTSLGAYPTFPYHVNACGGQLHSVPYAGTFEDLSALLDNVVKTSARIVYVSNPDNPMGTFWSAAELQQFVENVPESCLICLDEAYVEYAEPNDVLPLSFTRPNLLRFRTFSKIHGLAGLRVGFAVGQDNLVRQFDKIRNHFGVNRLAEIAASAALDDREYITQMREKAVEGRAAIASAALRYGLDSVPSSANFVAIDCGRDGAYADAVLNGLIQKGVFIRKPNVAPLNRHIRISVGTPETTRIFGEALGQTLDKLA